MYEIAKKARAGMKSKAERLAGEKDRKTDSSDWSPAEPLNADVKTGMRPVSRRAYKSGGKVAGCAAPMRADRKPRKAGGRVETKGEQPLVDRYVNRDLKKANDYRDGTKHVGALKHGGRAHKNEGGGAGDGKKTLRPENVYQPEYNPESVNKGIASSKQKIGASEAKKIHSLLGGWRERVKRDGRKDGGRAKKADGGYMSMEEMIRKNPAPAKKPLGLDKVPLPPRRPTNLTPAVPNEKYKKDTDLNTQSYKKGGRIKRSDGGEAIDKRLAEYKAFQERLKKEREDFSNEQERKYPGKSFLERVDADLKEKFSPAFFADLKAQRKKELAGNKDYQEFAARRAKKSDDDSDDKMKKGGRVAKASGGGTGKSFWGSPEFKSAFRAARNAYLSGEGPKNFEFQGKSYSTDLMKIPTPPSRPRPVQEKIIDVQFGKPSGMPKTDQMGNPNPGMKKGGRAKKADGGGMDPRLGIVSPKALNFAQNLVTPGLKRGGRAKREDGGIARAAGAAAMPSLSPVNVTTSAPNIPPVSSGLLPQTKGNYEKPPAYDPAKYKAETPISSEKRSRISSLTTTTPDKGILGVKKGGRIAKQIGGALGMSANRMMPQLPPQAMANAQGRPFQPGGKFNPVTTMPVNPIGGTTPMATTMPVDTTAAPMPSTLPVMTNPGGQQLPAQAIANAQGQPFQPGGRFNPMARANGGRIARASGGSAKSKGKGKTNINIIIAAGKKEPESMIPNVPQAPMGMPPMQKPNMLAAAPMGAGAPPMPPMGGGQPPMPGAFKQGGRVSKVASSFKDMTAGAGSGEGRLQKTDIAKRAPHKAGGKVYRSYKDMDAGSGSGKGRLEKTEIQSRKR